MVRLIREGKVVGYIDELGEEHWDRKFLERMKQKNEKECLTKIDDVKQSCVTPSVTEKKDVPAN